MATTPPATPTANQELSAARGGLQQCRYSLRVTKRLMETHETVAGVESLHDAIDALSVSVETLAKVVEGLVKP